MNEIDFNRKICDSPQYFYSHMEAMARDMGLDCDSHGPASDWCTVHPAQGIGYAKSTPEELQFILEISKKTGIILDPVYSGKALYYFNELIKTNPDVIKPGETVLVLHTGGVFGLYDKIEQMSPLFSTDNFRKMQIKLS